LVPISPGEVKITVTVDTSDFPAIKGVVNLDFTGDGQLLGVAVLPAAMLPEPVVEQADVR
jgi:hypothetical protein